MQRPIEALFVWVSPEEIGAYLGLPTTVVRGWANRPDHMPVPLEYAARLRALDPALAEIIRPPANEVERAIAMFGGVDGLALAAGRVHPSLITKWLNGRSDTDAEPGRIPDAYRERLGMGG